jgi:hypothetical protein
MRTTYVLVGALTAGLIVLGTPPVFADKGGEKHEKHGKKQDKHEARQEKHDDKWSPPDLSHAEREEWKDGRPPGWSRGVKRGWRGKDCPPGLAKKGQCPEARPVAVARPQAVADPWRDGLERLRRWGRDERRLPSATLDAVLVSFEGAVRHGVPVPMAERLVMATAARGVSPSGIEAITRAVAYGADHGASLKDLETFTDQALNRHVAADAIALGIYRLSREKP